MYDAIEALPLRGESEKWRGVVEIDERYEGEASQTVVKLACLGLVREST